MNFHFLTSLLLTLLSCQVTEACCGYYGCFCVYSLWYFWFGLFWIVVFLILLIVGCVKKHQKQHVQVSSVAVISNGNTRTNVPPYGQGHNKPVAPPAYGQPSHQPPPYQSQFTQSPYNAQTTTNTNPPPPAYPPTQGHPPPASTYPPPPRNDPAYPPVN